jgi:ketosteroid isomerase-like protein
MTLQELEKRVQVLEDLQEIMELQRRYMYAFDNHEFDAIIDCYSENAAVQIRHDPLLKGKSEIAKLYKTRGKGMGKNDAHFVSQPVITLNGDQAKAYWNVCILFSEPSFGWVQGRNDVEYIKEDGKWKFSYLKFARLKAYPPSLAP